MTLDKVSVGVYTKLFKILQHFVPKWGICFQTPVFRKVLLLNTNLEAANGRIMDVDIASESTQLAKYNILVQASASMLSQANATPNAVLMLLN